MEKEFNTKNIFVFLGPSLPLGEAKKILPHAYYMPPVQCGDIISIMRLSPNIIAIIDGYFENMPAVWHKEILYALEKGVIVVGGSSIGALRAAELGKFGMRPVGKIAHQYATGQLNEDDEVALLHNPTSPYYDAFTDPMVNIRATLEKAAQQKIINFATKSDFEQKAKSLFYQDRTLLKVIELAKDQKTNQHEVENFEKWYSENGAVDIKQENAKEILIGIARHSFDDLKNISSFQLNRSIYSRALFKHIMCRAFGYDFDWLPIQEKVAMAAKNLGADYRLCRHLAYLLSTCFGIAQKEVNFISEEYIIFITRDSEFGLKIDNESDWKNKNDCFGEEKNSFILRLTKIYFLIQQETQAENSFAIKDYIKLLMCISSIKPDYEKFKSKDPFRFHFYFCIASCWWLVENRLSKIGLQADQYSLQEYSNKFRQKYHLLTQNDTEKWMSENKLSMTEYAQMIAALYRLNFFVLQNNLDVLGGADNEEVWWFLDALRLSGLYPKSKLLLEADDLSTGTTLPQKLR